MKKNKAMRFIVQTSKKEFIRLFLLSIFHTANSFLAVYFALVMRNIINFAVAGERESAYRSAVSLIAVVIIQIVLFVLVHILSAMLRGRLEIAFRRSIFQKIFRKDYSAVSKFHSGDIQTRLWSDATTVSENVATLIPNICGIITRVLGALIAVFLVDATFALVILVGGIVVFVFARAFRGVMKKTHKDVQEKGAALRALHQESVENILVVKVFDMHEAISENEKKRADEHYKKKMVRAWFSTGASCGFSSLLTVGYVYAIFWGAWKIMSGDASFGYGDFAAIMQLINQIQAPFAGLSGSLSKYYSMLASAERILEICELPEDKEAVSVDGIYEKTEALVLDNISFAYGETVVFDGASCEIPKQSLTLISGISGIGKSTMIKLIMGVLKPDKGEIYIRAGENIPCNSSLRALFAYVPQGNLLMSGTVRENMLLAKHDATDDEISNALSLACADFLEKEKGGLDARLGERGSGLSEGQVQRLAIARAILCGAPVLLLDEATSALDEATEKKVLENIMGLSGKTCIAISHRSAAKNICTKEIYVRDGKIFERETE